MPWEVTAVGGSVAAPDAGEIRRAAAILLDPDGVHELRSLPSGRSRIVRGSDPDGVVAAALELADDRSVYYTLNPIRADRGDRSEKAARAGDVLSRRWLLVDVDRSKAVAKDDSATDAEKEGARRVAASVAEDLAGRGWPAPVVIDSGNAYHLLYRLGLPNDPLTRQWIAGALKALAAAHNTGEGTIDPVVHDPARIAKLPGTWVRKGTHSPERPHRLARLLSAPDPVLPLHPELLRELAGLGPAAPAPIGGDGGDGVSTWTVRAIDGGGPAAYVRAAVDRELARVALAPVGERNDRLNVAAFSLGTLLGTREVDRGDLEARLLFAATRAGLGEAEARATVRSGLDSGAARPRAIPERNGYGHANGHGHGNRYVHQADTNGVPPAERLTIRASEITPKVVRWLWRDRVAIDFISIFAGRTGLGKSFVACDLVSRLTTGREMPDGPSEIPGECRGVLFISEDPYEYILVPRLIELGADLDLVSFVAWEHLAAYTLDDVGFLDRAVSEVMDPILVIIDPPTNHMGDADEHRNAEVRRVLNGIVKWLNGRDMACILISHVNKQAGKGVDAVNRVLGSVAWVSTSRIALTFAPDPDEADRCLFAGLKNNLGLKARTLAYRIRPTATFATIEWHGEVETTADQALAGERRQPRQRVASEWLIERFREKREWFSDDLFRLGQQDGVSRNALFEAKKLLDLPRARQDPLPNGGRAFVWWVPPDWPPLGVAGMPAEDRGTMKNRDSANGRY